MVTVQIYHVMESALLYGHMGQKYEIPIATKISQRISFRLKSKSPINVSYLGYEVFYFFRVDSQYRHPGDQHEMHSLRKI